MTPYLRYLTNGTLPTDVDEAKQIKKTVGWYAIINGRLYWRGYFTPYLKCLAPKEAEYALSEIHLGICGSHIGGKNLALKIIRCQVHGTMAHLPHTELHSLQSPWLFAQWGLDVLGPMPLASGQRKFLIVGIDYFTKWVEVAPLRKIIEQNATEFLR
ncbi:hypothetical protein Nepgr_009633 [Nepenthes gracilis]|uniref:Gypsy retrotransposon integrase-like protein 1 n=1 Tax=Nepenthes gracilis TaxID=150966 RepID=A0AAD3SAV5_NEPGR|nr:hypothetical protein Nepgr_009633 [Nepenthes gracilis]